MIFFFFFLEGIETLTENIFTYNILLHWQEEHLKRTTIVSPYYKIDATEVKPSCLLTVCTDLCFHACLVRKRLILSC